jgi:2-phospho-L-lactate/phosphoenolpyruvate guanylyltransferase
MRTAAIVPVKRLTAAKQRLRAAVADPARAQLARAMIDDVLHALERCPAIERTIVVTNEPAVAGAARERRALVLADDVEDGQSSAVSRGLRRALDEGFERALCVPGDCPTLDASELEQLLDEDRHEAHRSLARRSPRVVIVPDRHGSGTNGLLLSPVNAISPSFGPDSCARHRALAAAAGASWRLAHPPSLLLDIDTGEDLAALRVRLADAAPSAPRTRAALARADALAPSPPVSV